jgi:hypothetical protein
MKFLFALALTAACSSAALAQQPSPYAPVPTPQIDPSVLKVPVTPLAAGSATFAPAIDDSATPKLKAPAIELGKSQLEFDARQTKEVIAPSTSIDSGETSNLSKSRGEKHETVGPNYFGLKLSVPTK